MLMTSRSRTVSNLAGYCAYMVAKRARHLYEVLAPKRVRRIASAACALAAHAASLCGLVLSA